MKSISVSIVGRPSSGKSTLINTICEMKVSITSPTPQTTRNKIKGIYTDSRGQIVFVDTPGFHLSDKEVNRRMREITIESLSECDVLLYLLDGKRSAKKEEETLAELVRKAKVPVVAAVNKKDILSEEEIKDAEFFIRKTLDAEPYFISAKNDEGIDDLLIKIFSLGPEGELMYDESQYTDQNLEFRISEIIREKTINLLKDEMPHVIFVEIEDIEYSEEEGSVWIRAVINTEREGQKGIVVGKGGENIKKIRKESFKEIKRIFPNSKLQLDLRVKSQSKWRNNQAVLDRIFKKNS